jgi:Na+-driven multidrug efflux pump
MGALFDLNKSTCRLESQVAMRIIRIGVPSGITQAIMATAGMVVQSLTNSMGEMVIAANVIIMRVDGFAMMPNFSFGQAMSVYTGQNVGAMKYERITQGVKQGSVISIGCSVFITAILLFANRFLFGIFTDTAQLIDLAGRMMTLMAAGYIGVAVTQTLGGVMRGAGDTVSPMWISIISTIVLRVPIAYILAHFTASPEWPNGHPFSLSASLLISWVLGAVMSGIVFATGKWKKKMLEITDRDNP